jgi:alkylation response protein AidB-like acyl-CoA dehydrogenase
MQEPAHYTDPPVNELQGVRALAVAATYSEKTDEQRAITEMVRQFVDEQVIPIAEEYDHEDKFPEAVVEQMKELGLFGVTIPEEYGGMGLDLTTYAMIVEELSRGWISISGIVNTHFIGSYLLMKFGSDEQKEKFLPRMASGEIRAAFSLSEPGLGSDVQAISTRAKKDGDEWVINGQKMWVTNGLRSGVVFLLAKSDPDADPPYKGMTCFITEKEPGAAENDGLTIPPQIKKMGYKGVESTELVYEDFRCPAENVLGGEEAGLGQGFRQMMDALEVGRVNVAARGVGIAQRALELALRYSQERRTFGKPIAEHQAIQFKLADMATKVEAARLLTLKAARMKDAGERSDLEAGMAKLFASEAGKEVVEDAFRIHGGYGYSKEYEIERLYRDAPLLLIGEGTSEIQRMVIGKKLLERNRI